MEGPNSDHPNVQVCLGDFDRRVFGLVFVVYGRLRPNCHESRDHGSGPPHRREAACRLQPNAPHLSHWRGSQPVGRSSSATRVIPVTSSNRTVLATEVSAVRCQAGTALTCRPASSRTSKRDKGLGVVQIRGAGPMRVRVDRCPRHRSGSGSTTQTAIETDSRWWSPKVRLCVSLGRLGLSCEARSGAVARPFLGANPPVSPDL